MHAFFGRLELSRDADGQVHGLLDFDNNLNPDDSVHRDLGNLRDNEQAYLLLGYALDDDTRSLIFNSDGLEAWMAGTGGEAESLSSGSFLAFRLARDAIRLWTDDAANVPLFYYESDELCLFSNSLLRITDYLKHRVPVSLCWEPTVVRGLTLNIAAQLVSDRTPIEGVRMLLRDQILELAVNDDKAHRTLRPKRREAGIDLTPRAVEKIGDSIAFHSSVFAGAAAGKDLKFFLSGGVDSRIVLGALRFAGVDMSTINLRTNVHPSRRADFVVVEELAGKFGFEVNGKRRTAVEAVSRNELQCYESWKDCNLGVYDMLYLHRRVARNPFDQIVLTGNGGGVVRSVYRSDSAAKYLKKIAAPHDEAMRAELERAAEAFRCDYDDPSFLDYHYLSFRNSLHAGRSFYSAGCKVVPLSSPLLMRLVPRLSGEWKRKNILHALLLLYYDRELLEVPFDRGREPFADDGVEVARRFLKGAKLNTAFRAGSVRVFGERRLVSPTSRRDPHESVPPDTPIVDLIGGRLGECESFVRQHGYFEYFEPSIRALRAALDDSRSYVPEMGEHFAKISMLPNLLG